MPLLVHGPSLVSQSIGQQCLWREAVVGISVQIVVTVLIDLHLHASFQLSVFELVENRE